MHQSVCTHYSLYHPLMKCLEDKSVRKMKILGCITHCYKDDQFTLFGEQTGNKSNLHTWKQFSAHQTDFFVVWSRDLWECKACVIWHKIHVKHIDCTVYVVLWQNPLEIKISRHQDSHGAKGIGVIVLSIVNAPLFKMGSASFSTFRHEHQGSQKERVSLKQN